MFTTICSVIKPFTTMPLHMCKHSCNSNDNFMYEASPAAHGKPLKMACHVYTQTVTDTDRSNAQQPRQYLFQSKNAR